MSYGVTSMAFHQNTTNTTAMKKILRNRLLLLVLIVPKVTAQEVIGIDRFLIQIEQFHPVAKQADLKVGFSVATLLASKGIFDPQLNYSFDKKELGGTNYYNYNSGEINVLTPLGVKVKAGMESNSGNFINPETSNGNYSYLGFEVPLLKNLLIDKKRATLKQAEIMVMASEIEKRAMLNSLYQEALNEYYNWAATYTALGIVKNNLILAENRLQLTRILWQNGEKSGIDTTEARTQWMSMQYELENISLELEKAKINVSSFLWDANTEPYLLSDIQIPDTIAFQRIPNITSLSELMAFINSNPELMLYDFKRNNLAIDRRLKKQALLPELNFKMNLLSKDYFTFENGTNPYLNENYKIGFGLNVPLFLREARGEFQKIEIKMKDLDFQQKQKSWQLSNKLQIYQKELLTLKEQIRIMEEMVYNFETLLSLEELRFSQGESSLFIINSRQNKLLDTQLKLNEIIKKYQQVWYKQQWVAGLLNT
jgi:outer membrane protein TolC